MSNMNVEEGYVYGFTPKEVEALEHIFIEHRFHSVALAGKREFQDFQQELARNPIQPTPQPKRIEMCVFRLDDQTPRSTRKLQERFPGYAAFFIANRPTHEMFKKLDHFQFLGSININRLADLQSELPVKNLLKDEFYAFEQATNAHLLVS